MAPNRSRKPDQTRSKLRPKTSSEKSRGNSKAAATHAQGKRPKLTVVEQVDAVLHGPELDPAALEGEILPPIRRGPVDPQRTVAEQLAALGFPEMASRIGSAVKYGAYLVSDQLEGTARAGAGASLPPMPGARLRVGLPTCADDAELRVEEDEWLPPHAYRLEVHHLTYERVGHEHPDDLIVLCPACHAAAHGLEHHDAAFTTSMEDALTICIVHMADAFKEQP